MSHAPRWRPTWNVHQIARDMALKGMLQQDLAQKAGVSIATVSRLLRGMPVSQKQVLKVARALNQRLDRYVDEVSFQSSHEKPAQVA